MAIDFLRRLGILVLFALAQALVLGNIHIYNCATPLLYVYFVLLFPRNYPRWAMLVMCFLLGLSIDIFSNTPGVASSSLTLVGFIQPYILELYLDREDAEDFVPAIATLGWVKYITYVVILVALYCLVFFSIEAFNFFNWLQWLMCIGGSFLITLILILVIDSVRKN